MNEVLIFAKVRRASQGKIQIEFGRTGTGDDIVDQWADRIDMAMRFCVQQTLIENGKEVPPPPLQNAVLTGNISDVERLLEEKPSAIDGPDRFGNTALHIATVAANSEMVDLLCRRGAGVNLLNYDGMSPLHLAARFGAGVIAKLLLESGATKTLPDGQGWTAWAWAKARKHHALAELLK